MADSRGRLRTEKPGWGVRGGGEWWDALKAAHCSSIPYSSKFLRHKNFMNTLNNFCVKNFVIAAKFREAWRGLIVAVVPCITTSRCLFLGCVLLIHSSFGWFCGRLGRWVRRLFSPALLPHICWPHCLWRVGFLEVSQQSHISLSKPGSMFNAS